MDMNAKSIRIKSNYNFINISKKGKIYKVNQKDFLSLFYSKIIPKFYKEPKHYKDEKNFRDELNDFSNSLPTLGSIQIYNDGVIRINLRTIDCFKYCSNNHIVLHDNFICRSIIDSFNILSTN